MPSRPSPPACERLQRRLRLGWQASPLPGREAAENRFHLVGRPASSDQQLRRPGARLFRRSGAIEDQLLVGRDGGKHRQAWVGLDRLERRMDGSGDPSLLELGRRADIDDHAPATIGDCLRLRRGDADHLGDRRSRARWSTCRRPAWRCARRKPEHGQDQEQRPHCASKRHWRKYRRRRPALTAGEVRLGRRPPPIVRKKMGRSRSPDRERAAT